MSVQIIAQVGDTHSLKFADMGKRRFLRLGASENSRFMQGTLHTGPSFAPDFTTNTRHALAFMSLTLRDLVKIPATTEITYVVTGAVAYVGTDEFDRPAVGILASVREVPALAPIPFPGDPDNVAKELDEALAEYADDPEGDLLERAILAYCIHERQAGHVIQQPSVIDSYTDEFETGRAHAVLMNVNGILVVYRVKEDGHIEYLPERFWPGALVDAEHEAVHE